MKECISSSDLFNAIQVIGHFAFGILLFIGCVFAIADLAIPKWKRKRHNND